MSPIARASILRRFICVIAAACVMLTLSGCASNQPKSNKAKMTISAAADVNPDATGRASPIVVRLYQLQQDTAFNNADFFALFDDDQKTLGGDLLGREEVTLVPGERKEVQFVVNGQAKFVAVIAAYRDIRNAQWRDIKAAPKKGLMNIVTTDGINVTVERAKVALTIKD